jgi:hypothetical protein
MINHARTLLLNHPRSRTHYSDYGYEYIPPAFKPVGLTPALTIIRRLLFGSSPDNYFLNFRVNELMSYLHATELAEYVYRLDNRVTYWPRIGRPYFEPAGKRVTITQIYGQPQRLTVAGNISALTAIGKACNFYTVSLRRVTEDAAADLQMEVRYEGKINSRFTVAVPNLNSPPIVALPDTELNLRLNPGVYAKEYSELLTEINDFIVVESYDSSTAAKLSEEKMAIVSNDPGGLAAQWLVETKVNPAPVITTVMSSMEMLGEPVYLDIFGVEDKEPYLTFKNLWFDHPLPAYRLSGIVLALIYRTEELRGKNV